MTKAKETKILALPHPDAKSPQPKGRQLPFTLLGPGGGEIYKVHANYPGEPQVGPCKIWIFWKDGPYPCTNVEIILGDVWRWQSQGTIWTGSNVQSGFGIASWTIPPWTGAWNNWSNFHPTNEWTPKPAWWTPPDGRPGQYLFLIKGGGTYTYGPVFNIVWSE